MTTEVTHPDGYKQGLYTPANPRKYIGNLNTIRYMSSWELEMHKFLDNNPNILEWSSEPIVIPYIKPTDGEVHRYFPDYYVKYVDKYGKVHHEIVEVKPRSQRTLREGASRKEVIDYHVNQAKWKYAKVWCEERGLEFCIISERPGAGRGQQNFRKRKIKRAGKRR